MPDDTPIPAATVVVMRDVAHGPPELLMVERSAAMAFAGGALVFPGGRVDPGDHVAAALHDGEPDDIAGRIGAIRETIEEAGLAVGLVPAPDADALAAMRLALSKGAAIGEVVGDRAFDLASIVPFARWLPRGVTHRIFDTRFYLARLSADAPPLSVDATENVRLLWLSASDVLAECAAGRASVIFPTRRNLERLARYTSYDDAVADALAYPMRTITPWIETHDGIDHLCIPDDLGYPVTREAIRTALRA